MDVMEKTYILASWFRARGDRGTRRIYRRGAGESTIGPSSGGAVAYMRLMALRQFALRVKNARWARGQLG